MFPFLLGLCGGICVDALVGYGNVRGRSVLTRLRTIGWREHSHNKRSAVYTYNRRDFIIPMIRSGGGAKF